LVVKIIDSDLESKDIEVSEEEGGSLYDQIQGTYIRFGVVVVIENIS
jgi:hypothetical protein